MARTPLCGDFRIKGKQQHRVTSSINVIVLHQGALDCKPGKRQGSVQIKVEPWMDKKLPANKQRNVPTVIVQGWPVRFLLIFISHWQSRLISWRYQ